jgi:phage-related protein (TIGR01555 family)
VGGERVLGGPDFPRLPVLGRAGAAPRVPAHGRAHRDRGTRKWIRFAVATAGPPQEDGTPPKPDATLKGVDPDKTGKLRRIEDELKRLKVEAAFRELSEQDGYFGRAHLYIDTGDTENPEELKTSIGTGRDAVSAGKVTTGKPLLRLKTVEPMWCYPIGYNSNNPLRPDWYNPSSWFVMGKEVHGSRLLTFVSREVPDLLKPVYAFGGLSLTQMAKPYVDNWLRTRQSVSDLISNFSTMIFKTDMGSTLGQAGDELFTRMDFFNQLRDNKGLMAIDKNAEEVDIKAAPLGTLDALQAQSQEQMASVCGIPIVIYLGIQPMGLNASSEGEIRVFYDLIGAYQQSFFGEKLSRVIDFVQLSLWGEVDPDITFEFVELWSMTAKELAEVRKLDAETDQILIDGGVLHPEESRKRIAADPASPHASIDVEDVPEPPEEPDPEDGGFGPFGQPKKPNGAGAQAAADGAIPFVANDDWSEADHPRGQPGNAGQFGSGGGGKPAHAPQFGLQHGHFTAAGKGGQEGAGAQAAKSEPKGARNFGEPIDVAKLKKIGGQKGSNPGGVYEGEDGQRFYVKKGKSEAHVRNELIAASLYDLAGTPTLQYRPVEGGGHVATEMAKLDKDNASKLSADERSEAARDFAVHAWLGNWDAVGLGGDNLGIVDGTPVALDLGGALEFRAQGAPKGKAFGDSVGELDTLRDPGTNKDAAGIFGKMTPAEMRESARYVTSIPDVKIRAAVERGGGPKELADKLIARKADVAQRARLFGAEGDPRKAGSTMVVPTGDAAPVKALNGVEFKPWRPPADWTGVDGQAPLDEPEFKVPEGKKPGSGTVIREKDGRLWLVQPRGGYGGYEATFPKGRLEEGLSLQANAIKETFEESGLKVKITGIIGDFEGDMTMTRYYLAEREGGAPGGDGKETEGVVLVPKDKADRFLNRKRDRAIAAHDEAPFDESKHKRDDDGKFSSTGGGGGGPDDQIDVIAKAGSSFLGKTYHSDTPIKLSPNYAKHLLDNEPGTIEMAGLKEASGGKAKKTAFGGLWKDHLGDNPAANFQGNAAHVLGKPANAGSSYRQMLAFMVKEAPKHGHAALVPALKAKLSEAFANAQEKALKAADEAQTDAEKTKWENDAAEAGKKAKEYGSSAAAPHPLDTMAKPKPVSEPKPKPAEPAKPPEPSAFEKVKEGFKKTAPATAAELEKAKKNIELQLQYVPGAPTTGAAKIVAQNLVNTFNLKWAGKQLTAKADLEDKVAHFKALAAAMVPLQSAEQQAQAAAQQEAAAAAKAQQAAAKKKQDAENAKAKAELQGVMTELGLDSEADASAVQGLMQMLGTSDPATFLKKFKAPANYHAEHGVTAFEMAMLKAYTGSAYGPVNKALRKGSWTLQQHLYTNTVNRALKKLPSYTETTKRGTELDVAHQSLYVEGHVVEERAFTSTSKGKGWGGNTQYVIQGKSGRDVQAISNHKSEAEVLYPARTFFRVTKVKGKPGGQMTVHMTEVEAA